MKKALVAIALLLALGAMPAQAGPIGGVEWNGGVFTVELLSSVGDNYSFVYTADLDDFTGGGHTDTIWGINFKPSSGDATAQSNFSEDADGVWTAVMDANLSAGGCSGGGNDFFCASSTSGQSTLFGGVFHWYFTLNITGVSDADSLVLGAPIRAVFRSWNENTEMWQYTLMSETTTTQVPEPGTLSLLGLGLVALAAGLRRRK